MLNVFIGIMDLLLAPLSALAGLYLRAIRTIGLDKLGLNRRALFAVGLLPVRRHYYEPFPNLTRSKSTRQLPGISWDSRHQWKLMDSFLWADEIRTLPGDEIAGKRFSPKNPNFRGGDADLLYSVLRHFKPAKIIEVGSGHSTLVAAQALRRNAAEGKECQHVCVEPYEMGWLESIGVEVERIPVEALPVDFFGSLGANDLLFIDSSHVVRSGGDVIYLVLEVLPRLAPGVIVHFHDIFSPADYFRGWVENKVLLWTEQYLLEAFLSGNADWEMLLAANYLCHLDRARVEEKCPLMESGAEPGSFYIRRKASS